MPIYEYRCSACRQVADILLSISDPDPRFCPTCGAEGTLRKQFAPPTIHYKGSGWAKKDRGGAAGRSSRESSSSSSDEGKTPAASGDAAKSAGSSSDSGPSSGSGSSSPSGASGSGE